MEELLIFNQNHWLTPLEKSQFFEFLKLLFLISLKEVFFVKYHETHFPGQFYQK